MAKTCSISASVSARIVLVIGRVAAGYQDGGRGSQSSLIDVQLAG
jgi:hypothetical protein